jgi:hypothetical protein
MCNNGVGKRGTLIGLSHSDANLYNKPSHDTKAWHDLSLRFATFEASGAQSAAWPNIKILNFAKQNT